MQMCTFHVELISSLSLLLEPERSVVSSAEMQSQPNAMKTMLKAAVMMCR